MNMRAGYHTRIQSSRRCIICNIGLSMSPDGFKRCQNIKMNCSMVGKVQRGVVKKARPRKPQKY